MDQVVSRYLAHLETGRRYSRHTLSSYKLELAALTTLLQGRAWSQLSEQDVRRYVALSSREGLAARSIARRLSCWRGYYDWLGESNLVTSNPIRGVRAPKLPKRLPKALSPDMAVQLVGYDVDSAQARGGAADGRANAAAVGRGIGAAGRGGGAGGGGVGAGDASVGVGESGEGESGEGGLSGGGLVGGVVSAFEALRDKAIIELLYSSGLRLSELIGLDWRYTEQPDYRSTAWIDPEQAEATVLGKGGKRRTVPIGSQALQALSHWLPVRQQWLDALALKASTRLGQGDLQALFIGKRGGRIGPRAVQDIVKRLARQQGIASNVHPHVLRHSFASHLLQSSGDLRAVQELLGHASIATTQIYTSLDFQRLAAVYDAAHPRARRKDDA